MLVFGYGFSCHGWVWRGWFGCWLDAGMNEQSIGIGSEFGLNRTAGNTLEQHLPHIRSHESFIIITDHWTTTSDDNNDDAMEGKRGKGLVVAFPFMCLKNYIDITHYNKKSKLHIPGSYAVTVTVLTHSGVRKVQLIGKRKLYYL